MKTFLIVFAFIVISSVLYSQEQNQVWKKDSIPDHTLRDFCISGSPNFLINTPNGAQFAGGLKARVFLGEKFSFDTDIVFGRDYFHAGPGIIGIPFWYFLLGPSGLSTNEESTFTGVIVTIASMILSAEHIAYHLPVNNSLEISPYVSMLRYKASYAYGDYNNANYAGEQFSFAMGLELNKYFKRFVLSPYAEWNIGYKDHLSGFNTGVYCGYYFRGN